MSEELLCILFPFSSIIIILYCNKVMSLLYDYLLPAVDFSVLAEAFREST